MLELKETIIKETISEKGNNKSSSINIVDGDLFVSVAELSNNGVFICDRNWNLIYANNRYYSILNCDSSDCLNKNVLNTLNLSQQNSLQGIAELNNGKINTYEFSTEIDIKVEARARLNISLSSKKTIDGSDKYFLGIIEDVTDLYQYEMELQSRDKLDTIGYLAGGIVHDLNNNLMGIMGCAELIKNKLNDNQVKTYADKMVKMASRASELTVSTLNFAKKGTLLFKPHNFHTIIDNALNVVEPALGPSYNYEFQPGAKRSIVKCDSVFIENVIINLAINARDAMYKGGTITFETSNLYLENGEQDRETGFSVPGNYLELKVSDHGTGIKEELLDKIFEPYFTTKGRNRGTGLGLYIAKRIVSMHGGEIFIDTKEFYGTSFSLFFPLYEGKYNECKESKNTELVIGKGNLMLVDDEELIGEVTEELLTDIGYTVHTFNCTTDAIAFYKENYTEIDAVILDMVMPFMSGKELFEILQFINPKIKAALITGYSFKEKEDKLLELGIKTLLDKPIDKHKLSIKVAGLLNN